MQIRRILKRAAWASALALMIAACGGEPQAAPAPRAQPNQATAVPSAAQSHLAAAAIVAAIEARRGPQESTPATIQTAEPTPRTEPRETSAPPRAPEHPLIRTARAVAAKHLELDGKQAAHLDLDEWESVTWTSGHMGCPKEGIAYTDAEIQGFIIKFSYGAARISVHMDEQNEQGFIPEDCLPTPLPFGQPRPEGNLDEPPPDAPTPQATKEASTTPEARDVQPGGQKDGEITQGDIVELIWLWTGGNPPRAKAETKEMLVLLNTHNPPLAYRLMEMPFMKTHEPRDTGAIKALAYMSMTDPGAADAVAGHPALTGGIRDDQTHAVALTYGERIYGANTIRTLEPNQVQTWTKTVTLPLSGQTSVTIAAAANASQEELADRIAQTLTWLEEYLDAPVPTANVLVYYGASLPAGARGGNLQVSISHTAGQTSPSEFHWTRHEMVHYWFNGNETWLDEGIAQVLTSIMEKPERGDPPPPRSSGCRTSETIRDTIGQTGANQLASQCIYSLGERFMLTLLAETGPEDFRTGIANLAQTAQSRAWPPLGLKDVRKAFGSHRDAVQTAAEAWYGTDG